MRNIPTVLVVVIYVSFIFLLLFFATAKFISPMASKDVVIGVSAEVPCLKVKDYGSIKAMYFSYAQRFYEQYISNRVVASDGEPIIPVLFSAYASYGDKCDKEILKMATVYLKRGADINARGAKYKNSAVVETIVRGKSEGFMFLLENGADLCLPNDLENGKSHNVMYIMTKLYEKYPDQYKALKEVVEKEYRKRC